MASADEAATTNPRPLAAPTARSERARKRRKSATPSGPTAAGPSRPTKKVKKGTQAHAAQVGPLFLLFSCIYSPRPFLSFSLLSHTLAQRTNPQKGTGSRSRCALL